MWKLVSSDSMYEVSTMELSPTAHELQCKILCAQLDEEDDLSVPIDTIFLWRGCYEWIWRQKEEEPSLPGSVPARTWTHVDSRSGRSWSHSLSQSSKLMDPPLPTDDKSCLVPVSTDLGLGLTLNYCHKRGSEDQPLPQTSAQWWSWRQSYET